MMCPSCMSLLVIACVLQLDITCAVLAISFCHRRGLGRWLIENAHTAVTFSPLVHNNVC